MGYFSLLNEISLFLRLSQENHFYPAILDPPLNPQVYTANIVCCICFIRLIVCTVLDDKSIIPPHQQREWHLLRPTNSHEILQAFSCNCLWRLQSNLSLLTLWHFVRLCFSTMSLGSHDVCLQTTFLASCIPCHRVFFWKASVCWMEHPDFLNQSL